MKKHKTFALSGLFLLALLPAMVFASPVIRTGDSVSIAADQVLEGDFYAAGGNISISGKSNHDAYVAGGTVTVNAEVASDLVVLGGTVQVHAPIGDDLRIVGGDITIAEHVGGDVVVLAGTVKILSTAQIEGDVLFIGGDVDISGGVKGSVAGKADNVRIDAGIGGDLKVTAGNLLTLGDRAEVLGSVVYKSPTDIARAQNAVVVGELIREPIATADGASRYILLPFLMVLFAALTAYLLFKDRIQVVVDTTKTSFGMNGLIGLAVFLAVPAASGLLVLSVLGIIPAFIILFSYIVLLLIAWTVTGMVLGALLLKWFTKTDGLTVVSVIIGVVLFELLVFVSYIGPLLAFAFFLIVLGSISKLIYTFLR